MAGSGPPVAASSSERAIALTTRASSIPPRREPRALRVSAPSESTERHARGRRRRMERRSPLLADEEGDEDVAQLAARLGRLLFLDGASTRRQSAIEPALDLAERLDPRAAVAGAHHQGDLAGGRPEEEAVLLAHAPSSPSTTTLPPRRSAPASTLPTNSVTATATTTRVAPIPRDAGASTKDRRPIV